MSERILIQIESHFTNNQLRYNNVHHLLVISSQTKAISFISILQYGLWKPNNKLTFQ